MQSQQVCSLNRLACELIDRQHPDVSVVVGFKAVSCDGLVYCIMLVLAHAVVTYMPHALLDSQDVCHYRVPDTTLPLPYCLYAEVSSSAACSAHGFNHTVADAEVDTIPSQLDALSLMDQTSHGSALASCTNTACPATSSNTLPSSTTQCSSSPAVAAPALLCGDSSNTRSASAVSHSQEVIRAKVFASISDRLHAIPHPQSKPYPPLAADSSVHDSGAYLPDQLGSWKTHGQNPAQPTSSPPAYPMLGGLGGGLVSHKMKVVQGLKTAGAPPINSRPFSRPTTIPKQPVASPTVGDLLSSAAEALISRRFSDCSELLTTAAIAATTAGNHELSQHIGAACTAAQSAAQHSSAQQPGPAPAPAAAATAATQQHADLATLVCMEFAKALTGAATGTTLPADWAQDVALFTNCELELWSSCSHPNFSSSTPLFVGSQIGIGGYGRVCNVTTAIGADPRYAVKVFSGLYGDFSDVESINEIFFLLQHRNRRGIMPILGAGRLLPTQQSNDRLVALFDARPVFFVLLPRMDANLSQCIQAFNGFSVPEALGVLGMVLLVLRDLHSQPEKVYAHR